MKFTRYFAEQVIRKRPCLTEAMIAAAVASPVRRERQPDGRWRLWAWVRDPRDGETRALRVVILEDGETVRNAFYDRDFEDGRP